jgi:uncharacterized protein (TIGR03083 family)
VAHEWIVEGLESIWDAIDKVVRPIAPEDYDRATPCPGWNVRDVLSHLLGFELMMRGTPAPEIDFEMPDYVRNVIGELNEKFVVAHRDEPGIEVLNQFWDATRTSLQALRNLSDEEWEKVGWSPEGDAPYYRFQETRILDSWIHLQDIRDALLMPEDDHGIGEEVVVNRFESALPYVIGKRAKAPEGSIVRFNLVGRLARSVTVQVVEGRAKAIASTNSDVTLEITTPVALFWRRGAGRISDQAFLSASSTFVTGDRELAKAIASGLAVLI